MSFVVEPSKNINFGSAKVEDLITNGNEGFTPTFSSIAEVDLFNPPLGGKSNVLGSLQFGNTADLLTHSPGSMGNLSPFGTNVPPLHVLQGGKSPIALNDSAEDSFGLSKIYNAVDVGASLVAMKLENYAQEREDYYLLSKAVIENDLPRAMLIPSLAVEILATGVLAIPVAFSMLTGCASGDPAAQTVGDTGSLENLYTVSWTAPSEREPFIGKDGFPISVPLSLSEIGEFRIYYGSKTGDYQNQITIKDHTATSITLNCGELDLDSGAGAGSAVMTTVDVDDRESLYSPEFQICQGGRV